MKTFLTILILIILFGCGKSNKTDSSDNMDKELFENFLNQFENSDLPMTVKACRMSRDKEFPELTSDKYSPFIPKGQIELAYCKFKTNGDFIATVSLGLADCLLPILTTWTKDGKQINRQTIGIGYCGSGPGYNCEEFMRIDKNFVLYTSDTIASYDLDSLDRTISGTLRNYVIYKQGKLLSSGKIELSDTIKRNLRK